MIDLQLWWLGKCRDYLQRKIYRLKIKGCIMRSKYRTIELNKEWRGKHKSNFYDSLSRIDETEIIQ